MPIAIKNIRNPRLTIKNDRRTAHSVSIDFEATEYRYHMWLQPVGERDWRIVGPLYKNMINPPRFSPNHARHLDPSAHAPAIDHVLRMAGAGEGDFINSSAVNCQIDEHMKIVNERKAREADEINTARAAKVRAALNSFAKRDILDPDTARAVTIVANNSPDYVLNALDSMFNVEI